jgi:glucose/arabinose dehydrogenase
LPGQLGLKLSIIFILILAGVSSIEILSIYSYGQKPLRPFPFDRSQHEPYISDSNLKVEQVVEGLEAPTTMAFLGPEDFLVLEKDKGTVLRVTNGITLDKPLLDVNVANWYWYA